jgi:Ca2+-binding RTX toxin-like protein
VSASVSDSADPVAVGSDGFSYSVALANAGPSGYGEGLPQILDNGSDTLYGGPGNDSLDGQYGNDTLDDHDGTDILEGNIGNDAIDTQDGVGGDTANGGLDTCTVDAGDNTSGC